MKYTIYINRKKHFYNWESLKQLKDYYVCNKIDHAVCLIRARGYVYLNQIYESLGVGWDYTKENVVFTEDPCAKISIDSHADSVVVELHKD